MAMFYIFQHRNLSRLKSNCINKGIVFKGKLRYPDSQTFLITLAYNPLVASDI